MYEDSKSGALFIDLNKKPLGAGRNKVTSPAAMYKDGQLLLVARSKARKPLQKDVEKLRAVRTSHTLPVIAYYHQHQESTYNLITPLFNRGSILDILQKRKANLSFREKVDIAIGLLQNLEEIHQKGYAHRDVKCGNTLVNIETTPPHKVTCALCDFAGTTRTENARGLHSQTNPAVRSPEGFYVERLHGSDYMKCDLFAAGCVLWSLYYEDPLTPWAKLDLTRGRHKTGRDQRREKFVFCLQSKREAFFAQLAAKIQRNAVTPQDKFLEVVFTIVNPLPSARGTAASAKQQMLEISRSLQTNRTYR